MKRIYIAVLIAITMLLSACAGENGAQPTQPQQSVPPAQSQPSGDEPTSEGVAFTATVYDVDDNRIMVANREGGEGISMIHVNIEDAEIEGEGIKDTGAVVEITAGEIMSTYPEQCDAFKVKLIQPADAAGSAGAGLFAIFEHLYGEDTALNQSPNLAFDIKGGDVSDTAHTVLMARIQQFCLNNNYNMLPHNREWLALNGYIKDMMFPEGFLVEFDNVKVNGNKVSANMSKWVSGLGAIGGLYTATYADGEWTVQVEDQWIS